jgi:hypothetical protein
MGPSGETLAADAWRPLPQLSGAHTCPYRRTSGRSAAISCRSNALSS